MKTIALLFGFCFIFEVSSYASVILPVQNQYHLKDDGEIKKKWDAALGSFQFEILKNRIESRNFQIDMSVIYQIEESRQENEVVYLQYNDYIRIKVLPKAMINGDYEHLELINKVDEFTNL